MLGCVVSGSVDVNPLTDSSLVKGGLKEGYGVGSDHPTRTSTLMYSLIPDKEFQVQNYWLERVLGNENSDLPQDFQRIRLLESLVKPTAQFGVDLESHLGPQPISFEESFIRDHMHSSCDPNNVRAWVYLSLLKKAVHDANAVALLRSASLSSQAFNIWRSLFQTNVVCQFIANKASNDQHLTCRYVVHSIIRATVRRWEEFNETCCRQGKPPHYSTEEIDHQKSVYEEVVGKWGKDYVWTGEHNTFRTLAKVTKSDMLFYQVSNNQVHPTFGISEVVTGFNLPLAAVPLVPVGVTHDVGELSLEFQTAKLLSDTTRRASGYTALTTHLKERMQTLKELAATVLRDLR